MPASKVKSVERVGLILAGGQSKRLFPIDFPKPLLKVGGKSLLLQAIERLKGFETYVVTNKVIAEAIKKDFKREGLKVPPFIIEPEGRDTAAAVGWGLRHAPQSAKWIAVLSADTYLPDLSGYKKFLNEAMTEVRAHPEALFVAGSAQTTKPSETHSQFGWILRNAGSQVSEPVKEFVEKPQGARLEALRSAGALINAGMFFGARETFLKAYHRHYPEVLVPKVVYKKLERQPVDRAIFEKFENVRAFVLPQSWEDLGTWDDWAKHVGEGKAHRVEAEKVFVKSDQLKSVYVFGLRDLAVVESAGRLLIVPLSKSRDLKNFLEKLK